jgi:hypothetical protein
MRREQLEHAIRTACQIIEHPEVIVVGSQAILGAYDESQLPAAATTNQRTRLASYTRNTIWYENCSPSTCQA